MAPGRHNGGERRDGVDIGMLVVAALAAVAAALVTSKLWPGGTLVSTAMTPVIVTLVKEWLRKPAERISAVSAKAPDLAARVVAPARDAPRRAEPPWTERQAARVPVGAPAHGYAGEGERPVVPPAGGPAADTPLEETFVERAPGDGSGYRLYRRRGPHWRVAAITGLLAFVVAAGAITIPELALGGAVTGSGGTTVFGGGSHSSKDKRQKSTGKSSNDGRTTSTSKTQQQEPTPTPATKSAQPSSGSPSQPSTQQAPSTTSPAPQGAPSTPSPSSPGQSSPGSGSGSSPSSGQ